MGNVPQADLTAIRGKVKLQSESTDLYGRKQIHNKAYQALRAATAATAHRSQSTITIRGVNRQPLLIGQNKTKQEEIIMANQVNTQTEVKTAQETTTLAKVEVDNSIFKVVAEGKGQAVRFTTTFDDAALFNAVNGGSDPVKKYLGHEVEVTDMLITSAELHEGRTADGEQDENTPIVSKPCVHFYTKDGQHLTTLSNGIVKSAKNLISCGFAPSEGHSIVIKFRTVETKKGTAHTFDLIKRN